MDCVLPMLAGLFTSIIGFSIVMLIGKILRGGNSQTKKYHSNQMQKEIKHERDL